MKKGTSQDYRINYHILWGYFFGIKGIVFACLVILGTFISPEVNKATAIIYSIIAVSIWGIPGYFVIKRRSWAWTTLTILSLNLIIWGINYFYGKKRWDEFDETF